MNKIYQFFLTLVIGDYILDELTKDKKIYVLPRPFAYLRNKFLGVNK